MERRVRGDQAFSGRTRTMRIPITAKTASYTVLESDFGGVLTTRGASGAITFTLPAVQAKYKGAVVDFVNVAGQNMIIAGTAGELVVMNDLAANSVAVQTASELIGGSFRAICDGTSWLILPNLWPDVGGAAQTATVVT